MPLRTSIVTTGPFGGHRADAVAPNRVEIHDFVKNEKMFSLYVQALRTMMNTPQDDPSSFFQVAAIHGLPYEPWDGVGDESNAESAGYCTHGSVLFPTWHRPYVALFEQILQKHAQQIASRYVFEAHAWRKSAEDLRQPYWDWAKNAVPPPEVISMERVIIAVPDGRRTWVENPFRRYRFHPIDPSFAASFTKWPTTLRYPTHEGPNAADDVEALIAVLQANQADLTAKVYGLLARVHTWLAFSCHAAGYGDITGNSLEAIHDAVHDCAGGSGHMGDPAYAAFDPIFLLHHSQVDRLLSLWSALHPDVWVSEAPAGDGTFTIPPHSTVGEDTALTPFRSSQSTFWTSRNVTGTCPEQLGYSYPEFNGLDLGDKAAVKRHIAELVNELYAPETLREFLRASPSVPAIQPRKRSHSVFHELPNPSFAAVKCYTALEVLPTDDELISDYLMLVPEPPRTLLPAVLWEWTARVRVQKHEVGSSFSVLLFLGGVPDDPAEWYTSSAYVGAHHAFVNSTPQRCANCQRQAGILTEGFVHLTEAIVHRSWLTSFEPETVRRYLWRSLSWRVRRIDGTAIDASRLPSLEVVVAAQPLSFPASEDAFLALGKPQYHTKISQRHLGGSGSHAS